LREYLHTLNDEKTEHDGVFFIKKEDIEAYITRYQPMQLRWSVRTKVSESCDVLTFGLSKGLEFERVIIYPTSKFIDWLKDSNKELAPISRSKFYVAVTRASNSVAIVCDENIQL